MRPRRSLKSTSRHPGGSCVLCSCPCGCVVAGFLLALLEPTLPTPCGSASSRAIFKAGDHQEQNGKGPKKETPRGPQLQQPKCRNKLGMACRIYYCTLIDGLAPDGGFFGGFFIFIFFIFVFYKNIFLIWKFT